MHSTINEAYQEHEAEITYTASRSGDREPRIEITSSFCSPCTAQRRPKVRNQQPIRTFSVLRHQEQNFSRIRRIDTVHANSAPGFPRMEHAPRSPPPKSQTKVAQSHLQSSQRLYACPGQTAKAKIQTARSDPTLSGRGESHT